MNKTYINMKKTMIMVLMFISTITNAQICLSKTDYPSTSTMTPGRIIAGDFNNDGNMDIVTSNFGGSNIFLFNGNSVGALSTSTSYATGLNPYGLASGYINNDANLDVLVANYGETGYANSISYWKGNGSTIPTLTNHAYVNSYLSAAVLKVSDISIGYFTQNTYQDFVYAANTAYLTRKNNSGTSLATAVLNGAINTVTSTPYFNKHNIAANLNSDAVVDLLSVDLNTVYVQINTTSTLSGSFSFITYTYTTNSYTPTGVCVGDLNNDNNKDIIMSSNLTNSIQVMFGSPTGTFGAPTNFSSSIAFERAVASDLDNDGNLEVIGVAGGTLVVLKGNGNGGFTSNTTFSVLPGSVDLVSADMDLDGDFDLVVASTNSVSVLLNKAVRISSNSNFAICSGSSITLTANGSSSYVWSNSSTSSSIVVSPTANVTYTLSGATISGCTPYSLKTVTVNSLPPVTISGTSVMCVGNTATMSVSGAVSYSWNTGSTLTAISAVPNITTTYSVNGLGSNGCSKTNTFSVVVNPLPTIVVNGPNVVCSGTSATLTASGAQTYTWLSLSVFVPTIVISPTIGVQYYVSGTDNNGCTNVTIKNITVHQLPIVYIVGTPTITCAGDVSNIVGNGALTYSWNTGATSTSISVNPTVTTSYSVIGTDVNGCTNIDSLNLVVKPLPTVTIVGSTVVCAGETTTLTANGAPNFVWNNSATSQAIAVSPLTNTTYSVVGTATNGCSNSAIISVISNTVPTVSITSTSVICLGESTQLKVDGAGSYTWSTGQNFTLITVTPTSNTTYSVVGENEKGCKDNAAVTVTVSECLGFNKISNQEIALNIFPNPNNGNFTIKSETDLTVTIMNEIGQVVKKDVLNQDNNKELNVSDLDRGIYFVVCSDKFKSTTKKVIVTK